MHPRFDAKLLAGAAYYGAEGKASHEFCQKLNWLCLEAQA